MPKLAGLACGAVLLLVLSSTFYASSLPTDRPEPQAKPPRTAASMPEPKASAASAQL